MVNKLSAVVLFIFFLLYANLSMANTCPNGLQGHVTIITKEGRLPDRKGIPIYIRNWEKPISSDGKLATHANAETNEFGIICLELTISKSMPAGKSISLSLGDADSANWSNWRFVSPYQGKINMPLDNALPEIIISPQPLFSLVKKQQLGSKSTEVTSKKCKSQKVASYLQVTSLPNEQRATEVMNTLSDDYSSCIASVFVNNRTFYRVLVALEKDKGITCNDISKKYKFDSCKKK